MSYAITSPHVAGRRSLFDGGEAGMTAHDCRIEETGRRARLSLGGRLRAFLKSVQYGQMVSVLNRLPDVYLKQAGLRRCDIPRHARRLVYGED